uniref:2-C-methyl-D-erythritol 4-phosphate cytidylyltransferase n=1 Tax=Heterorhabditis bacteriophora TaxID=37862 RepID=A0A1I7WDX4_HETBA
MKAERREVLFPFNNKPILLHTMRKPAKADKLLNQY